MTSLFTSMIRMQVPHEHLKHRQSKGTVWHAWSRRRAGGSMALVDAMASDSNAQVPRFWSRFHKPGSEAVDALSVLDWAQSRCSDCGGMHREVLHVFPAPVLLWSVIQKACPDGARCVMVVPVSSSHHTGTSSSWLPSSRSRGSRRAFGNRWPCFLTLGTTRPWNWSSWHVTSAACRLVFTFRRPRTDQGLSTGGGDLPQPGQPG
jgi:hypothetical protein